MFDEEVDVKDRTMNRAQRTSGSDATKVQQLQFTGFINHHFILQANDL
jgi:hypothetical protein